jgi:hypothetical protein
MIPSGMPHQPKNRLNSELLVFIFTAHERQEIVVLVLNDEWIRRDQIVWVDWTSKGPTPPHSGQLPRCRYSILSCISFSVKVPGLGVSNCELFRHSLEQ